MILTATAPTEAENNLLKFAPQQMHSVYSTGDRPPSSFLIHWLWQHHFDSLQSQFEDLSEVQAFFNIS